MTRDPWGEIDDALRDEGEEPPAPGERAHGAVYSLIGAGLLLLFGGILAIVGYRLVEELLRR